jgi:hypothetical protein
MAASPATNGGRGLKQSTDDGIESELCIARQQWRARIETTLAAQCSRNMSSIARQQWRARIETTSSSSEGRLRPRIARQQWRARIETTRGAGC